MGSRVKNIRNSLLSVVAVVGSVEYFKIWTRNNYDVMHCYTRVNQKENVFEITSTGTTSCDLEAQEKQISKKLQRLKGDSHLHCVNFLEDKIVGYYALKEHGSSLQEYCIGDVMPLL